MFPKWEKEEEEGEGDGGKGENLGQHNSFLLEISPLNPSLANKNVLLWQNIPEKETSAEFPTRELQCNAILTQMFCSALILSHYS